MEGDVSRVGGIDGLIVISVLDRGWRLELEAGLAARAPCCRWVGGVDDGE